MLNKRALDYTTGADGSYAQLFNPLSQVLPGKSDRIPTWTNNLPGSPDTRYMAVKIGAVALLAAALTGGARWLQHISRVGDIRGNDNTAKDMDKALNTAYEYGYEKDRTKDLVKKAFAPVTGDVMADATGAVIPSLAFLLAAAATYAGVDKLANKRRENILDTRIEGKRKYFNDLIVARAKNARGGLSKSDMENIKQPDYEEVGELLQAKEGSLKKTAADAPGKDPSGITAGLGLLAASVLGMSALASYAITELNDPNNLKYKAYKKGLETFAAQKAQENPIDISLGGDDIFKAMDANRNKVKAAPAPAEYNKPAFSVQL